MFGKSLLLIGLASAGLLLVLLNTTTPSSSGAAIILFVFFLAYVAVLAATTFLLWGVSRLIARISKELGRRSVGQPMTVKKAYFYASVIALAPIIIISLQSVGGVGIYEVGLIGLFVLLGCIYIARRTA